MKKWIRIKGVAAFAVITAALVLFVVLFADTLVKKAIETTGTLVVGARVELADADLTFFPAGLSLTGLAVTNPDAPMRNAVEARHIALSVETAPLFFRKCIVPEMAATGIRFDTERSRSGAVIKGKKTDAPKAEDEKTSLSLPSLDIKDPKKILEQETLASVEEAEKIQADIKTIKSEFKKRIADLPDEEDFKAYEKRIKELTHGKSDWKALLTKAADLEKISDEVERDIQAIKTVKKDLEGEISTLEKRIKSLPKLAQADYTRLKETYGPSAVGAGNITGLLFGDTYKGKVETAVRWYKKIQPMLEKDPSDGGEDTKKKSAEKGEKPKRIRGKGVDIAFKEKRPLPEFLISRGILELEIPAGTLSGTVQNVTAQQPLVGRPMALTLAGRELKGIDAVDLTATIDRVSPQTAGDRLVFSGNGIGIRPVGSEDTIRMEGASASVTGHADIAGSETLDAGLTARMTQVRFAESTDPGTLQQALNRALKEVKEFSVEGVAKGPLDSYDLSVSSDLDTHVKKALKNATKELTADFNKGLQAAIKEKTGSAFSATNSDLGGITDMDDDLSQMVKEGKGLL
ncbi:TIGR03545 family protein [Desulfoluna spongiiphila]|uniref:TIGR03545 family protein n=1 Tax=Desulfoluna spongiiphila TaxID=419481 RepID=UPI0012546CA1|nr:TIGR03545 family protein [Desulfoluna spongiiphila]VVS93498.1 consensus disorder prediction [Desulfoluna spongiiphila]